MEVMISNRSLSNRSDRFPYPICSILDLRPACRIIANITASIDAIYTSDNLSICYLIAAPRYL
jgi:hypothetical protein